MVDMFKIIVVVGMLMFASLFVGIWGWRFYADNIAETKCSDIGMIYSKMIQYPIVECVKPYSTQTLYINISKER